MNITIKLKMDEKEVEKTIEVEKDARTHMNRLYRKLRKELT